MNADIFDENPCILGEGPLWHPGRGQLFWFDIEDRRLLTRTNGTRRDWQFPEMVSAGGWIDDDTLLIAGETHLMRFDIATGDTENVHELERHNLKNRSNDGRADPWGGFWIGTMAKDGAPGQGAIYRYWRGEMRCLHDNWTIPNAICFPPDRRAVYFTDTPEKKIYCQPLARNSGWPDGPARIWLDVAPLGMRPDGAVIDADGRLWCADWGGSRVVCFGKDGRVARTVDCAAAQISCPAFGGPDFTTLFVTSAAIDRAEESAAGFTFVAKGVGPGCAEPRVVL